MATILANAAALMLATAAAVIQPPEAVDYERWAVDHIVYRSGPLPGPYSPAQFPFFTEILKALGPEDPARVVTFKKSAQVGGTELANIFTLGTQAMDPCDFMYIHPTEENASRWSKLKLTPMLKNTTAIAQHFPDKSRDGGDSVGFKQRIDGRGSILISGANSPASLSMVSIGRQVQDDLSKWETTPMGDPETMAESRSRAFTFAKIFKISTPLVNPGCKISRNFDQGSQEFYHVPCPHCDHLHVLEWANMLANLDEDHPEQAHFSCPECGGVIEEHHRAEMVKSESEGGKARWIAKNPEAARYHRSFWLWSAYGPLQRWEEIAREWLRAKGDPKQEQVFLNDSAGLAYDAKGEAPPWEEIRDRAANAQLDRGTIVQWGVVVTLGIDCQADRVEWQAVAWGRDYRRHVIDAGIITGHVKEPNTVAALDKLVGMSWRHESGRMISIDRTAIDGNAWTEDVWAWARRHPASRVIMVRGVGHETAPRLMKVRKERSRTGDLLKYAGRFYNMGTSPMKMALYRNLTKTDPLTYGYVSFPRGLEDEYFRQLTAESRKAVKRRDGFTVWQWVKDPNQRNEMLDTMVQAEAAAEHAGVFLMGEKMWTKIEAERCAPLADAQLDLEDMITPQSAKPAPVTAVPRKAPLPRRTNGFVKGWA